jgi:glycosyltransferase involved in cell wall biosynthesis
MRVGVDATSWVNKRGFGRFARNAIGRLVALDPDTTYVLYIDAESADGAGLPEGAEERRVQLAQAPSQAAAAGGSRGVLDLLRLTRAVRRDRLDAFLFPSVYTYFPVVGVPTVVGVHDAILEQLPHLTVPSRRARALSRLRDGVAVRRATRLFTVSEASRRVLAERLRLPPEQLAVVPEAPAAVFAPRTDDALARGLAEAGLAPGDRFFVFAGGISPHKNVETLVDAYAGFRAEGGEALLVLVGEMEDDPYLSSAAAVRERIARHALGEWVRTPGFVSDEALACLYGGATAVVLPSLAEGFGLPAVEAAACGAPLVLSDLPAHRETLDGAALFFEPTDTRGLAEHLRRIAGDDELRSSLGERARAAVAPLTWDAAAERLRALLRETAGSRDA